MDDPNGPRIHKSHDKSLQINPNNLVMKCSRTDNPLTVKRPKRSNSTTTIVGHCIQIEENLRLDVGPYHPYDTSHDQAEDNFCNPSMANSSFQPYHVACSLTNTPLYLVPHTRDCFIFEQNTIVIVNLFCVSHSPYASHSPYTAGRTKVCIHTIVGTSPSQRPAAIQNIDISRRIAERKKPSKNLQPLTRLT